MHDQIDIELMGGAETKLVPCQNEDTPLAEIIWSA